MTVRTSDFRPLTSDRGSICAICVPIFIGIGAGLRPARDKAHPTTRTVIIVNSTKRMVSTMVAW